MKWWNKNSEKKGLWMWSFCGVYASITTHPIEYSTLYCCPFFVVVISLWFIGFMWRVYLYSSGLIHWHWGNHMIAPVPVNQPWRIWIKPTVIKAQEMTTIHQSVLKIRSISHAQDLSKLARSRKQLYLLCPPHRWALLGTALLSELAKVLGAFEKHWIRQYLVKVVLFGMKDL